MKAKTFTTRPGSTLPGWNGKQAIVKLSDLSAFLDANGLRVSRTWWDAEAIPVAVVERKSDQRATGDVTIAA